MKLFFVVNARMPHKKAYGIQVAKMCEALIEAGVDLTLVVPRTLALRGTSVREFYALRVDVPTVALPSIDRYASGRVFFLLSSVCFMTMSGVYLLWKKISGTKGIVYTVDMDTFSFALLPLSGMPLVAEMHMSKPYTLLSRFFFRRATLVVATNPEIRTALQQRFGIPDERMLVEPNGVDLAAFEATMSKEEVRSKLNIPNDAKVALYVGRFFDWKGLDILAHAARLAPEIMWYVVGGNAEEFEKVTDIQTLPPNLHIVGECTYTEVPRWLAAADTLLILGTEKNQESYRETAPMKVYEYMAAQRPVVASRTPALTSFIPDDAVSWYESDDSTSLAETVRGIFGAEPDTVRLGRGHGLAQEHSWQKRALRIMTAFKTGRSA